MIRRPFMWRKMYTTVPIGHSTIAAAAKARKPKVGPTTLQRHGLLVVPHCTHMGTPTPAVMVAEVRKIQGGEECGSFCTNYSSGNSTLKISTEIGREGSV